MSVSENHRHAKALDNGRSVRHQRRGWGIAISETPSRRVWRVFLSPAQIALVLRVRLLVRTTLSQPLSRIGILRNFPPHIQRPKPLDCASPIRFYPPPVFKVLTSYSYHQVEYVQVNMIANGARCISRYIVALISHSGVCSYLLNEINVVESSMNELRATTRERQELTRHLHPILMPLHLCKQRVWYVVVPYLLKHIKVFIFIQLSLHISSLIKINNIQ